MHTSVRQAEDAASFRLRLIPLRLLWQKKFVAVASKVSSVLHCLKGGKKVKFLSLFQNAQTKSDMVATFLAVLELAKTKTITIEGEMANPSVQIVNEVNNIEQ